MTAMGRLGLAWIVVGTGMAIANFIEGNIFHLVWLAIAAAGVGLFTWNGGNG